MIEWRCKKFHDLTVDELYDLLRLRSEVFVVEQKCIFLDQDNIDQHCLHLSGYQENKLIAYARIVPPSCIYEDASIGRVVTLPAVRNTGIGKQLMQEAIQKLYSTFGNVSITIGAQLYLKRFYESFGFYQVDNMYLEDGIEHIHMKKPFK